MSLNRLQICVPLLCREIVLRILLISANANIASSTVFLVPLLQYSPVRASPWFEYLMLPVLVILHHILRLWPRTYWLVICEVISSLGEAVAVGVIVVPRTITLLKDFKGTPLIHSSFVVVEVVSSVLMGASTPIACFFLLCDVVHDRGKSILHPYEFSAGLCQPGCQWSFIWGRFTTKKRFTTENFLIRCIRGGFAILCLLAMSYLVIYTVIWERLQWNGHLGARISKAPVLNGNLRDALAALSSPKKTLIPIQAVLAVPADLALYQYPNMTLRQYRGSGDALPDEGCYQNITWTKTQTVSAGCNSAIVPSKSNDVLDILITVYFPGTQGDFRVYLGMAQLDEFIMDYAEPTGIGPGSNLHGWSSISVKELPQSHDSTAIGVPGAGVFAIMNVRALSPDLSSSLPRDNNTATLRVTVTSQRYIEIEQQYFGGSVLSGVALVGGVWTFINGIFAAVFGSTLLLVLFGIKPLSVYGLMQFFRRGKVSLVEANHVLSPEERDRIVAILREHLLDVDIVEGDGVSPSRYNSISILPHFRRSQCNDEC